MSKTFAATTAASLLACLLGIAAVAADDEGGDHPGAALYAQYCATCHAQPDVTRAPAFAALKLLTADSLRLTLTEGIMEEQAKALDRRQLAVLIDYLARKESDDDAWLSSWMCSQDNRAVSPGQPATVAMHGVDYKSTRSLSDKAAGLTSAELPNLELAWAIGFPDTNSLRSSPAIVGDTMFYSPAPTHRLLALDFKVPCVRWVYDASVEIRTSVTYGRIGQRDGLVFADRRGQVHAVDAVTGQLIWKADGRHSDGATITGAPLIYKDRIIVPVSGSGVGRGANPNYECCAEHGAVVALDARSGEKLWTYHTMEDASYTGKTNSLGVKLRGPSGAPIWSSPSIDVKRGLVYATTGQNTSLPATDTSDAVLAIDIETGKLRWSFQALANDVWIIGCRIPHERSGPNCPSPKDSVLKDFDFGAAAILVKNKSGQDVLLAGQKSGDVWSLDPDTGKLLWNRRLGQGTPLGGVHWGMATDGKYVFVPINDPAPPYPGFTPEPGMNALDISTGEIVWRTPTTADCTGDRKGRFRACDQKFGLSSAPLVIDHSVVAASLDGRIYIYDAATGKVVFTFDTLRAFETANGYPGKGGSIDSHSIFAGGGMLFVNSGYGSFGQAPGNVLLGFKPKAAK